jgi:hypothetical protein
MNKKKIKLVVLGHLPYSLNLKKVESWTSEIFEVQKDTMTLNIDGKSDGNNWCFTDESLDKQIPQRNNAEDIIIAITNVPLEFNYYVRRFKDNRVCLTYYEMADILQSKNIPLENLLLRFLYSTTIIFKYSNSKLPLSANVLSYFHDDTRSCIFDFNGIKSDVVYSLNKPIICHSCIEKYTTKEQSRIENELIIKISKEIKLIKKSMYYQIVDFVKIYPILSLIFSSIFAIVLGTIGSVLATVIWELI